jgi:hypothetical protein
VERLADEERVPGWLPLAGRIDAHLEGRVRRNSVSPRRRPWGSRALLAFALLDAFQGPRLAWYTWRGPRMKSAFRAGRRSPGASRSAFDPTQCASGDGRGSPPRLSATSSSSSRKPAAATVGQLCPEPVVGRCCGTAARRPGIDNNSRAELNIRVRGARDFPDWKEGYLSSSPVTIPQPCAPEELDRQTTDGAALRRALQAAANWQVVVLGNAQRFSPVGD